MHPLLPRLQALLQAHSEVVLWGPPGIGKTFLAQAAAEASRRPVVQGPSDAPGSLVLMDRIDDTVDVALGEGSTLLATSWVRPQRPGRIGLEVPPLSPQESRALLHAATGGWLAADEDAVDDLVDALGGVPLALELAAGVWDLLGPRGLLQRRAELDTLLADPARAEPRHRSTGAALEAAWAELDPADQTVLCRLSTIRGLFGPDDVQRLVGSEALDSLRRLRARGMVRPDSPGRLRVPTPLRSFATRERLATDSVDHRMWVLDDPPQRDPADLKAALRSSLRGGTVDEALALLTALRQTSPTSSDLLKFADRAIESFGPCPPLLVQRARILRVAGEPGRAKADLDAAQAQASDPALRADIALQRAGIALQQATPEDAIALLQSAVDGFEEVGDAVRAAVARGGLACAWLNFGQHDAAAEELERCLATLETGDTPYLHGHFLGIRAVLVLQQRGDRAAALADCADAEAVLQPISHEYGLAMIRGIEGLADLLHGRPESAARSLRRAVAGVRGCGFPELEGRLQARLVGVLGWLGETRDQQAALRAARRCFEASDDPSGPGIVDLYRALAALGSDQAAKSVELLQGGVMAGTQELLAIDEEAHMIRALIERTLPAASVAMLRLTPDASRGRLPDGAELDLSRHQAARRLLDALADAWAQAPGEGLSKEDLFAAGWPGVTIAPASASTRLRTELSRLRRLGLAHLLQAHAAGYRIDPTAVVVREDLAAP